MRIDTQSDPNGLPAYQQKGPAPSEDWLLETAELLDAGSSALAETSGSWSMMPASHAQWEWDEATAVDWAEPVAQVHVVLLDWMEAADAHVRALAALVRAGAVSHSVPYLVRAVLEHSHKVMWLLEASHEEEPGNRPVSLAERAGRAYLEELYSLQHRRNTVKKLSGKASQAFGECDRALVEMRTVIIPGLFVPIRGDTVGLDEGRPASWRIAGQRWMGPTALAERYGRRRTGGSALDGTYDSLSAYSHPTLYAHREFLEYSPAKGGVIRRRSIPLDFLSRVIGGGATTFWRAAMDLASYFGWPPIALVRWGNQLNEWRPGLIASDPDESP